MTLVFVAEITADVDGSTVDIDLDDEFEDLPPIMQIQILSCIQEALAAEHARRTAKFKSDLDEAFGPDPH
jgi:hypothetical protein